MSYVAAAYLVIAVLMVIYVVTLISRQRLIAELADAARRTNGTQGLPAPR